MKNIIHLVGTWRIICSIGVFLLMMPEATSCLAGGGPENVFLLVNSASRDSLTVANHYIDLRKIPPTNIYYLDWKDAPDVIGSVTFRKKILQPALKEIEKRQLAGQVDYIVYSCGFPTRVSYREEFKDVKFPGHLKPLGSITSATFFYAFIVNERREMISLDANFYCVPFAVGVPTTTSGFRSQYRWSPGGQRTNKQGLPYMLSAMLGVRGDRANTLEEIIYSLNRSSTADGTKPAGTVYFMQNKGPRSTPRHDLFPAAIKELRLAGVKAKLLDGKFPDNKRDVIGVTTGTPFYGVRESGCRLLPGAICDNLTSFGGLFVKPVKEPPGHRPQTTACEFIRNGGAGAWGTVTEPFALRQKFALPSVHTHYVRGCSMAEAFYQSVMGPYQQILLGDPLCQPWATMPQVAVSGVVDGDRVRGSIEILPEVKPNPLSGIKTFELFVDGKRMQQIKPGAKFILDTKQLSDGQHELRVVATEGSPIETQGRWIGKVIVKNGLDAVQLSVSPGDLHKDMQYLEVKVVSTKTEPVSILHNGREVGRVAKGSDTLQIQMDELGSGPVTLYGQTEGDVAVRSHDLRIDVP